MTTITPESAQAASKQGDKRMEEIYLRKDPLKEMEEGIERSAQVGCHSSMHYVSDWYPAHLKQRMRDAAQVLKERGFKVEISTLASETITISW